MKPRPRSSILVLSIRPPYSQTSVQCRRTFHAHHPAIVASRLAYAPQPQSRKPCSVSSHASYKSLRHASSSAAAVAKTPQTRVPVKKPPPQTTLPRPIPNSKLNPPEETYAAPLHVPPRRSDQNYISYLWGAGKAYISFYKTGIMRVRSTAKLAKQYREKVKKAGQPPESVLTRAEWQILRRSKKDILRLPGFAVLVLLLGEWLPLIVIWITPVVPEACRIPAQVEKQLRKMEARRKERERRIGMDAARLIQQDRRPGQGQSLDMIRSPQSVNPEQLGQFDLLTLLSLSAKLDAHSGIWDRLFMTPPKGVLRWGLKRKLDYLRTDDSLIQRDGGWASLGSKEMQRACLERGIDVLGVPEGRQRLGLAVWFGKR